VGGGGLGGGAVGVLVGGELEKKSFEYSGPFSGPTGAVLFLLFLFTWGPGGGGSTVFSFFRPQKGVDC